MPRKAISKRWEPTNEPPKFCAAPAAGPAAEKLDRGMSLDLRIYYVNRMVIIGSGAYAVVAHETGVSVQKDEYGAVPESYRCPKSWIMI